MGMQYFPDHASVPQFLEKKIRKSFFPPPEEEKDWMHLGKGSYAVLVLPPSSMSVPRPPVDCILRSDGAH